MFRIDHPSAVAELPTPGAAGTPGYFGAGDPGSSTAATTVTADWANAIQEEIVGVIVGAGLDLDKANNGQLLAAINAMIAGVGTGSLLKSQNLADLTNAAQARSNLGLGSLATKSAVAVSDVSGLAAALAALAPINSPTFTGHPKLPATGTSIGGALGLIYEPSAGKVGVRTGISSDRFFTFDNDGSFNALNGGGSFAGTVTAVSFDTTP